MRSGATAYSGARFVLPIGRSARPAPHLDTLAAIPAVNAMATDGSTCLAITKFQTEALPERARKISVAGPDRVLVA